MSAADFGLARDAASRRYNRNVSGQKLALRIITWVETGENAPVFVLPDRKPNFEEVDLVRDVLGVFANDGIKGQLSEAQTIRMHHIRDWHTKWRTHFYGSPLR